MPDFALEIPAYAGMVLWGIMVWWAYLAGGIVGEFGIVVVAALRHSCFRRNGLAADGISLPDFALEIPAYAGMVLL